MSLKSMMFEKVKEINHVKLNQLAKDIGTRNNKSATYVKFDMFRNFIKYGIGYTDYLKGDYINLTKEQKNTYVTTKSFYKILRYLNHPMYTVCMHDKLLFNKIYYDFINRNFIDLRVSTVDDLKNFVKNKKHVFAKPPHDFGGHGIQKLKIKNIEDYDKLYKDLRNKGIDLVEEEIIQHPDVSKLNPYAVNAFRVVTLLDKNCKPHILANALRINLDDAEAVGCTDAYMRLNEKGEICSRVVDDLANVYEEHPLTHYKFKNAKIPFVKEALEMCKKAALKVPEVRYVGWDVAITPNGPIIMEGNEYPSYGLVQYYLFNDEHEGHLKQLESILGNELKDLKL